MTPTEQAARWLADVPRHYDANAERVILEADALAAIARHIAPWDDLVERLRACANGLGSFKTNRGDFGLCDDAADRLSVLKAENEAIKEANENLGILSAEDVAMYQEAIARAEAAEAENATLRDRLARMEGALRWAHDTLWEINPSNYGHDDVCKLNDASVEVILGIAPLIGETQRAALTDGGKHE